MKRGVDDSTVYSIVFVLLEIRSGKKKLWKNCNPNSPDATRHLMFCFAKETASFIQEKFEHLKNEILSLENIKFTLHDYTFVISSSFSTIYTTMNDGKTLNAVVSKMLLKNIVSQCCHLCQGSPKEFNLETIWNKDKNVDKNILKLGICSLHLWICSMRCVFNTACKLPAVKQGRKVPAKKQPRIY